MSEHEGIWSEYRPTYWDGWSAVKRVGDLVRCKDCKHAFDEGSGYLYCGRRPGHCFETCADGFCKWGEPKEEA